MHTIAKALLGGAFLYCTVDQASDLSTYYMLKSMAMQVAMDNDELKRQLGVDQPDASLSTSAWYDSSIRFTHQHHIATAIFSLHGNITSTDVEIKVRFKKTRRPGPRSSLPQAVRRPFPIPSVLGTLIYNTLGPRDWQMCDAPAPLHFNHASQQPFMHGIFRGQQGPAVPHQPPSANSALMRHLPCQQRPIV